MQIRLPRVLHVDLDLVQVSTMHEERFEKLIARPFTKVCFKAEYFQNSNYAQRQEMPMTMVIYANSGVLVQKELL